MLRLCHINTCIVQDRGIRQPRNKPCVGRMRSPGSLRQLLVPLRSAPTEVTIRVVAQRCCGYSENFGRNVPKLGTPLPIFTIPRAYLVPLIAGLYYHEIYDNLLVGSQPQCADDIRTLAEVEGITTIFNVRSYPKLARNSSTLFL